MAIAISGVIDTGIWRNVPFPFNVLVGIWRLFLKNLNEGIQTILYCAISPDLEGVTGKYYRDCKEGTPDKGVHDPTWQRVLFEKSVKIVQLGEKDPKI